MERLLAGIIPDGWTEVSQEKKDFIEITATVKTRVTDKNREKFKATLSHIKASLETEFGSNLLEASVSIHPKPLVRVLLRREKRK